MNIDDLKELSSNDRLEVAFMIAHKEFGVEQLLDASGIVLLQTFFLELFFCYLFC